jgi:hypothetical protein
MKKLIWIIFYVFIASMLVEAQNYTATIGIGEVNISGLNIGDEVVVPVKLIKKTGGLFSILQFYIEFDHSILKWKGSYKDPLPGIRTFQRNMAYAPEAWAFNDNGYQLVALWNDPKFMGVSVEDGDTIVAFVFTLTNLPVKDKSYFFRWSDTNEYLEGRLIKGVTEIIDESSVKNFDLIKIDGEIKY